MPPAATSPSVAQQEFIRAVMSMDPVVMQNMLKLIQAIGGCGHRKEQTEFLLELTLRLNQPSPAWPLLSQSGKHRITANLVNGKITTIEIGTNR